MSKKKPTREDLAKRVTDRLMHEGEFAPQRPAALRALRQPLYDTTPLPAPAAPIVSEGMEGPFNLEWLRDHRTLTFFAVPIGKNKRRRK